MLFDQVHTSHPQSSVPHRTPPHGTEGPRGCEDPSSVQVARNKRGEAQSWSTGAPQPSPRPSSRAEELCPGPLPMQLQAEVDIDSCHLLQLETVCDMLGGRGANSRTQAWQQRHVLCAPDMQEAAHQLTSINRGPLLVCLSSTWNTPCTTCRASAAGCWGRKCLQDVQLNSGPLRKGALRHCMLCTARCMRAIW